ncbi:MAG: FHA domain-containing protein [Ruminococcaceae bacterium]|nr:FHA domain-containing protein [Oscillospiraceae bacterium]
MNLWQNIPSGAAIGARIAALLDRFPNAEYYITLYIRWILVILALLTVGGCVASLLRERHKPELWGYLQMQDGSRLALSHWENLIGRAKSSDVVLADGSVSRAHACLNRDDDGEWSVYPVTHRETLMVNGAAVKGKTPVKAGDLIRIGQIGLVFEPITEDEQKEEVRRRARPGYIIRPWMILLWLTEFQIVLVMQHMIAAREHLIVEMPLCFAALTLLMWCYFFFIRAIGRTGFEPELLGFFLTTLGMSVVATSAPDELPRQLLCVMLGLFVFIVLCLILRSRARANALRWLAGAGAVGLLLATLVFGTELYGAKNWIIVGGMSFQPSELAKICFIFAGTATLDRLWARRNLIMFVVLTGACMLCLAMMSDFGTALIFFVTFIVIAFLRSGDLTSLVLVCAGAGYACTLILRFKPYIARRFGAWRHAWENASSTGYQQTRTMSAAASGGLFGMGAGKGWLHNIGAADTDLVFGILCEELGLIIAVLAVASIAVLAVFAVKSASLGRSTLYVIAACAAMSMLVVQTLLNVCGSVDLLPLTGVTFPFVSNGGSSMIGAWGLLAFIKAADTRQNASIAIPLPRFRR